MRSKTYRLLTGMAIVLTMIFPNIAAAQTQVITQPIRHIPVWHGDTETAPNFTILSSSAFPTAPASNDLKQVGLAAWEDPTTGELVFSGYEANFYGSPVTHWDYRLFNERRVSRDTVVHAQLQIMLLPDQRSESVFYYQDGWKRVGMIDETVPTNPILLLAVTKDADIQTL